MQDSLKSQLAAMNAENRERIPAAALSVMDAATRELAMSDIIASVPEVGASLPDFELPNAVGETIRLSSLRQRGPVVVAFYRGGWCPYCNLELRELGRHLPAIKEAGAELVAISPQTPDASLTTAEKHGLAFEVLSDQRLTYARKLGLVFQVPPALREIYAKFGVDINAANGDDSWELPIPATFVIDKDGIIRHRFADPDYTKRMDPVDIVAALGRLP